MTGSRGLRGLFRRQPNFGSVLDASVLHHDKDAYTPTETIAVVPDETLLLEDPGPEGEEAAPEPEPEPLPDGGYAIGPQILTEHEEWRWLFPWPAETTGDAPRYGWVDVSEATAHDVVEFLGGDLTVLTGGEDGGYIGVRVRTSSGDTIDAHVGDRIIRDEDGLHVQCTRAFEGWTTGAFEAVDAAIAAGQGDCT